MTTAAHSKPAISPDARGHRDPLVATWQRARARAAAEHTRAWYVGDGIWHVVSQTSANEDNAHHYQVTSTGPLASDLTCNCEAGQHQRLCKHAVCVADSRFHGWESICMGERPSESFGHCTRCQCWYPVHDDSEPFCDWCLSDAARQDAAQLN